MSKLFAALVAGACFAVPVAQAAPGPFTTGPVIADYGEVADVPEAAAIAEGTIFRVAFDVAEAAEAGKTNRYINSAARFINMNARAGVPLENIRVAIVIHGPASGDLLNDEAFGGPNPNAGLIAALIETGVTIELCGQTAAYRGIEAGDLLPGVTLSLSAMNSHARLQGEGYTLNPF